MGASAWKTVPLGDFISLQRGHDLPQAKQVPGPYPVMGSAGPNGTHIQYKAKGPGVVLGRSGASFGKAHFVCGDYWPHNTCLWVTDFKGNDPRFVYYILTHLDFSSMNSGSAQPSLNRNYVYLHNITVPDPETQRRIASILGAYDDLIENNLRRIRILEEMAQRLYREWFVHFRFPGHHSTPMTDSPLGPIPEGWEVKAIGEAFKKHIGGGWGKEEPDKKHTERAFVIRGTDIPGARHGDVSKCPLRYHTSSNLKSRRLSEGDLIMEVSGGSKDQPVGRPLLVSTHLLRSFDEDVICASFCKSIQIDTGVASAEQVYLHLLEIYDDRSIEQYEVQSTGIKNFKFAVFLEKELIPVAPNNIQQQFLVQVRPIMELVQSLGVRSQVLRRTRDLLLPKLISGQIISAEASDDA